MDVGKGGKARVVSSTPPSPTRRSVPLGDDYSGEWQNARTYLITLTDVGTATPGIGSLTVTVIGNLLNAALSSQPSDDTATLGGNWGTKEGSYLFFFFRLR